MHRRNIAPMEILVINREDLEDLVKTSTEESLHKFFTQKEKAEKRQENFTVKEAATFLNVSELTIRNYIKRGLIKANRIGNRILINRELLESRLKEVKSLKYRR